jgi:2,4-dienoyl-CoA reductase-like NADH-dependent reductase (Old Yellow Enzyme family)
LSTTEDSRRVLRPGRDPHLFRPVALRSVTAKNRIMVSPMCQYTAEDGVPNDWHFQHLAARAVGGAGIVFTEVAHVEARGRITPKCLGIWNDDQRDALTRITDFITGQGAVPAIQIGHAGRKAATDLPWNGGKPLALSNGGWPVIGPSAEAYGEGFQEPQAMDQAAIDEVIAAFAAASRRSREAGFKIIEIHAAHGYLLHEFLSPLSNRRNDGYGGDLTGRARLLMETIEAIRSEWPGDLPLFLRVSSTEWVEGGYGIEDMIEVLKIVAARGDVDLVDCSSGGNDPGQQIPIFPGYQVQFSEAIKRETGLMTAAVGLIHTAEHAEEIIANGRADIVALARSMLHDPYWALHAAATLKADVDWPVQYERGNIF